MTDDWDQIGFVISSKYRVAVLEVLAEGPATPTRIATESELSLSHISRALSELTEEPLVTLLVSDDRKKGRVYALTERGEQIWEEIQDKNMY